MHSHRRTHHGGRRTDVLGRHVAQLTTKVPGHSRVCGYVEEGLKSPALQLVAECDSAEDPVSSSDLVDTSRKSADPPMNALVGGDFDNVATWSPKVRTVGTNISDAVGDVRGLSGGNVKAGTVDPPDRTTIGTDCRVRGRHEIPVDGEAKVQPTAVGRGCHDVCLGDEDSNRLEVRYRRWGRTLEWDCA